MLASGLALLQSCLGYPSVVAAALAVDERFDLRERVTTLLTLPGPQVDTPAGEALKVDAEQRLKTVNVAEKFPIYLPWSTALLPVCTAVLAVVAFFLAPQLGPGSHQAGPSDPAKLAQAQEIKEQLDKLKKEQQPKKSEDLPKSDQLKDIEAAWDKLVQKPLDPKDDEKIRERIQEMRTLEEKMKERIQDLKGLAQKNQDLKKTLEKLASRQADAQKKRPQDGPAKDLQDALQKGQFDKAKKEIERLAQKLQEEKLSKKEKEQLAQQLQDLHDQLQRLMDQKERQNQLQRDFDLGKINKDQLDRELDKLTQELENLEDLQDLAGLLDQCKDCLGKDGKAAAQKLKMIRAMLEKFDMDAKELEDLLRDQKLLEEARLACLGCMNGQKQGRNGLNGGGPPGTKRPVAPDDPSIKAKNERQHGQFDPQGQLRVTGFSRGGTFNKVPAKEVGGAFKQATQDAPEAIERQRIPPDAADMAKGYFQKLGGQKN